MPTILLVQDNSADGNGIRNALAAQGWHINMAKNAGLPWDSVLSAELSGHYKPDKEVYETAADLLDLPPENIMMVAAHKGDLRAAQTVGFKAGFVPRPLEYGPDPGFEVDTTPESEFDINAVDFLDLAEQLGT